MSLVELERTGNIRTVILNAPERLNALDMPLLDEMRLIIDELAADSKASVVVVTGAGRGFCAGADLNSLFGDTSRPTEQMRDHLMDNVYSAFLGLRELKIPTIAAVHGAAVGAGLNIALACDVIVAGPKAKFGPTFAEIGLHPGGGCSWMLTERIGRSRATAAMLSGALIGAEEAQQLGLSDVQAEDAKAYAKELAERYSSREQKLLIDIKKSMQIAATEDLPTSLAFESWAQAESIAGPRFNEFTRTFTAKQP